ncbi:MAG: adenylate/guanylate cyclase domain-containing protein [Gammaproteobacteria bacterium]|nr:adenylate/guanylate cyclase domain-containing protein [Gammaproteobacteria bacterium]
MPFSHGVLVFALACAVTFGLHWQSWSGCLEAIYYDLWHRLAEKRTEPLHTAIVKIDDESLLLYPKTPLIFWGPHFARAIEVLDKVGAKVIGLDFLFSVSAEEWMAEFSDDYNQQAHTYDIPLRTQLSKGKTILMGMVGRDMAGRGHLFLPVPDLLYALPNGFADIGLENIPKHSDGVVRQFHLAFAERRMQPRLGFGALLASRAVGQNLSSDVLHVKDSVIGASASLKQIGFVGPPGTVPKLPFAKLLAPRALEDPEVQALRGRVVIISPEMTGTRDVYPTPYASRILFGQRGFMTGAEVHANVVETLLSGRYPRAPKTELTISLAFGVLGIAIFAYFLLNPWLGLLVGFALAIAWATVSYLGFLFYWQIPVFSTQAGLLTAYLGSLSFRLIGQERFNSELKGLLSRYVSSDIANRLITRRESTYLGGERKIVTILFSDIRNFTTIAEYIQPEDAMKILNTYFGQVSQAIAEEGGRVDKFMGDAVMAVFGDTNNEQDHAWRAVRTACRIERSSKEFRNWMTKHFPDHNLPNFSVGIGIDTGPVVVGNVGSSQRMEYTEIGDTVNVASRLQGVCKELGCTVLASRTTIDHIEKDKLICGRHEKVSIKGRQKRIEVFEVCGLRGKDAVSPDR